MIQMQTVLEVADNSGAKKIACILPLGGGVGKVAHLGDVITASVKEAAPESNVKKGTVVKAVIVRTKKEHRRRDGSYIRFDKNAAVLINDQREPIGTRVFGPVAHHPRRGAEPAARPAPHPDLVWRAGRSRPAPHGPPGRRLAAPLRHPRRSPARAR